MITRIACIHIRWSFDPVGASTYDGWDRAIRAIRELVHPFETLRIRPVSALSRTDRQFSSVPAYINKCDVVIDVLPAFNDTARRAARTARLARIESYCGIRILSV